LLGIQQRNAFIQACRKKRGILRLGPPEHLKRFGDARLIHVADAEIVQLNRRRRSTRALRGSKHRDTKTQRHKGALKHILKRAFVSLCLCVSVFTFHFSFTVTIPSAFTLDNRSTCPLGHRTSTLSACVKPPNPNVRIFSLCE